MALEPPRKEKTPKTRKSRPDTRRSQTLSRRQMMREARRRQRSGQEFEAPDYERPKTRADCATFGRPCLYISCKFHLYLDVNPVTGSLKVNFPEQEVWELEHSCALDVAEQGGITLEDVGEIMNLTRERIRQLENTGLTKLRDSGEDYELDAFLDWDPHRAD